MKRLFFLLLCTVASLSIQNISAATYYGIKVGGVEVKSDNASNVTGDNIKANNGDLPFSVVYDHTTKTLTLDNIKIERTGSYNRAILNESCDGLTIVIKHSCDLRADDASPVRLNKNTTIKSTLENGVYIGILDIFGVDEDALTVGSGATLTLDGVWAHLSALESSALEGATGNEKVIIKNYSVVELSYFSYNDGSVAIKDIASLDIQESYVNMGPTRGLKSMTCSDCMSFKGGIVAPYVSIDATTFPDEKLREYILSTDFNVEGKGVLVHIPNNVPKGAFYLGVNTIEGVTSIKASDMGVANAKGLEMFVNLTTLDVRKNNLTALNVTPYKSLIYLHCEENQLSSLNTSRNTELEELFCYDNQLTALNVSNNEKLTKLYCQDNQLAALYLMNNKELTEFQCNNNQLTTLNLSNQPNLPILDCSSNQLTSLTLACSETLTALTCSENKLTTLNLSGYNKLNTLYCNTNQLTSLALPKGDVLREVYCSENKLTTLDASGNTELTKLQCQRNSLTSLNVKNCGKLNELYCLNNNLSEIDLTDNTAMTWLNCSNNVLTTLDVSKNKELKMINASCNKLETLDLSWNYKTENGVVVWGNKIKGEGLDNLIASLPSIEGRLINLVNHSYENEDNECTAAQVEAAKKKGWTIYHTTFSGSTTVPTSECKNYDLWIKGLRASNHGTGVTGATYNDATKTLTLNNANITCDEANGLLAKIPQLIVNLTGDNKIAVTGNNVGMRFQSTSESIDTVTIQGGGSLEVTSASIGILTSSDLIIKDGTKISAESTDANAEGLRGRKYVNARYLPSLTMMGEDTELRVKGGANGSFTGIHALDLRDGITIAEPKGAIFLRNFGVASADETIIANEWVVFKKGGFIPGDVNGDGQVGIGDIVAVTNVMAGVETDPAIVARADVNNDTQVGIGDIVAITNIMAGVE